MQHREVGPGVFWVETSHTNITLIVDGRSVTMVDSGYPKDRDLVDAAVGMIGRSLTDVEAMLLTHGHVRPQGIGRAPEGGPRRLRPLS